MKNKMLLREYARSSFEINSCWDTEINPPGGVSIQEAEAEEYV